MTYPLTSLRPDSPDHRDYIYTGVATAIPKSVDLRRYAGAIEDQQNTNSCTANAGVSACEIWAERAGEPHDFSRLFLYFNERDNPYGVQDNGAEMRRICYCLNKQGVCLESTWPFDVSQVNAKPPERAYAEAETWKVGRYERIENLTGVINALANGCPVLLGMYIREPFFGLPDSDDNYQWLISQGYTSQPVVGSHAMLIVGYDGKGNFIIENSWGTGWASKGYGYVPYGFVSYDAHDFWVFTEFAGWSMDADRATIARLYTAALGRAPDTVGLDYWTNQLKGGMVLKDIAKAFTESAEFQQKYGAVDDTKFVELLYNNVLHRAPDAGGAMYWSMRLNPQPQMDRLDVLISFSESDENKANV